MEELVEHLHIVPATKQEEKFLTQCLTQISINWLVVYRESVNLIGYITRRLSPVSINLLVVYRESVNLIGYITRRLSDDSLQLWIANENRLFWTRDACFTPQCASRAVFETFELPM